MCTYYILVYYPVLGSVTERLTTIEKLFSELVTRDCLATAACLVLIYNISSYCNNSI
jgi:hypothetical protein